MNIAEERKAFESEFDRKYPAITADAQEGDRSAIDTKEYAYGGWLLAKEHFIEMAKPAAKIALIQNVNGVKYSVKCEGELLVIKLDYLEAIQWAKDNGYRMADV